MRQLTPFLWLAVVFLATLVPSGAREQTPPILCVLCGDGMLADGILNAMLFLPLGAGLSAAGWRPLRALAAGMVVSLGVETLQSVIPGRDPSLSDLVFNSLGTALGIAFIRSSDTWFRPRPRVASVLSISSALAATAALGLTGVLFGASFPEDTYYGGWTPRFGHLGWYDGSVQEASIDGVSAPSGVIARSADLRQHLLSRAAIQVRGLAGSPPPALAPLFTIHDGHRREILLLGFDGNDLVYRFRTRGTAWGLDAPELRVIDAVHRGAQRESLSIVIRQTSSGFCVVTNETEHCGLGYTLGRGWALLLGSQPGTSRFGSFLDVIWLAVLFLPAGLWARVRWPSPIAAALSIASLAILPAPFGLLPTPGAELLGALAGFLIGVATGTRFSRSG